MYICLYVEFVICEILQIKELELSYTLESAKTAFKLECIQILIKKTL